MSEFNKLYMRFTPTFYSTEIEELYNQRYHEILNWGKLVNKPYICEKHLILDLASVMNNREEYNETYARVYDLIAESFEEVDMNMSTWFALIIMEW